MKVEYLFSRNKKWGSRAIAWAASHENTGLEQIPSHAAVLIDETWVFESTFSSGVRVVPYSEWLKINEELYKVPCSIKVRSSKDTLEKAAKLWGSKYDWLGILFFTWRYLGLILLKKPLPSKNRWESPDRHFCTEFMAKLTEEDYSMKSPARICANWLGGSDGSPK